MKGHDTSACMRAQSLSGVQLFVMLWTLALQDLLSVGFSRTWVAISSSRGSSRPGD